MKKIKPVLQRDISDCGVSSMLWIIKYYGGYILLEKLREETFTGISGTNAYHIVETFKKYGFDSYGAYLKELSKEYTYPLIAHMNLENGLEHFVVVKSITNSYIYLMDPGVGNVKMNTQDFYKLFTGHIIVVYPKEQIIKMDKSLSISKILFNILVKEKFLILKIIITNIMVTILIIVSSYYLKIGSNTLNSEGSYLKYLIIFFGIITFLRIFSLYIRDYYNNFLSNLVDTYVYPSFLNHIFCLPLKSIRSRTTGEIVTRISELSGIKNLFIDMFVTCTVDMLLLFVSMVILYVINKKLFLILFIVISLYILISFMSSKIIYKKILKNINYQTEFNSYVVESIDAFESIKNLNITKYILEKIEKKLSKLLMSNYMFNKFLNIINMIKEFLLEYGIFIINSVGFIEVLNKELNIVDLFTFNIIISYALSPIKNIISLLPRYNYVKASFSKISDFINIDEEVLSRNGLKIRGNIEFKNVSYSYNNYDYILKNINFNVKEGEHVLINGASGSGKSTICNLIYKEKDANVGKILIDGINIKDISLGDIRNNILYVSQNEEIFTGTIKDNIILNRNVNDKDFYEICDICEIEDIVSKKALRYESLIKSDTSSISGGEKQRIILARGLLKNANIIILDEALSEVDYDLECKIITNIRSFFRNKTIIYISHKNNLSNFSRVINIGGNNGLLQS